MANRKLVVFKIDGESFGVDITHVHSIQEPLEVFKVPNTPDYIEGLINLRGKIYTIFNLRQKFNLEQKEIDDSTKIIIVKLDDIMVGFLVDEVNEIVTFDDSDIETTPSMIVSNSRKYLAGVAKRNEKIVLILDLTKVEVNMIIRL